MLDNIIAITIGFVLGSFIFDVIKTLVNYLVYNIYYKGVISKMQEETAKLTAATAIYQSFKESVPKH